MRMRGFSLGGLRMRGFNLGGLGMRVFFLRRLNGLWLDMFDLELRLMGAELEGR
ncbi:hypothetical protein I79_010065 [Cricetulus griseus]|uniref:Uncharacterized protein n=1 Tax=Cricetulus griseus TaxID=10029 RepID=G3HHG5_CRIGR|nr:hypothetical protein I79_010065 [Cricetulus griseus]